MAFGCLVYLYQKSARYTLEDSYNKGVMLSKVAVHVVRVRAGAMCDRLLQVKHTFTCTRQLPAAEGANT